MAEFKDKKLSARSKVINSWNSSWKSIAKEPIMPTIFDITVKRNQKTDNKEFNRSSDQKKVTTKDCPQKVLPKSYKKLETIKPIDKKSKNNSTEVILINSRSKDTSKDKTNDKPIDKLNDKTETTIDKTKDKDLSKELKRRLNMTPIDDSITNGINQSEEEKQITDKTDTEFKAQMNPVLNKLRSGKIDSMNPTVVIERTKFLDNQSLAESKANKAIKTCVRTNVSKDVEQDVEMDTDLTDICLRPDCYKKVSWFHLYENKYCSSDCAVKQWTEDFQKIWKK